MSCSVSDQICVTYTGKYFVGQSQGKSPPGRPMSTPSGQVI